MSPVAILRKPRTWLDQVIDDEGAFQVDVAIAMLLADRAGTFGVVPRPNPKRLAGELNESLPTILAALARLVERGHLQAVPRRASGGYRLIVRSITSEPQKLATAAHAAVVIPYSECERRGQWARVQAARLAAMPRPEADAHMEGLLRAEERRIRKSGRPEAETARRLIEVKLLLWEAYSWAILAPGDCS